MENFKVGQGYNEIFIKSRGGEKHINQDIIRRIIQVQFVDLISFCSQLSKKTKFY